jgi:tetratricopeptide (TPR) repeat protein
MRDRGATLGTLLGLAGVLASPPVRGQDLELPGFAEAPSEVRDDLRRALFVETDVLGEKVLSPRPTAEARRELEALAARRPAEASVQRYLARTLDDLGQHAVASTVHLRAESLAPDEVWPIEDTAAYNASRGTWTGELGALRRIVDRRGKRLRIPGERRRLAETLVAIADAIEVHQIPEDPLPHRRQAAELDRDRHGASSELVRWLVDQGRPGEALDQLAWARRTWPEDHTELADLELGLLYRLERYDEARDVLLREALLEECSQTAWIWNTHVDRLERLGELEAELQRVRTLLRGGPLSGAALSEAVHLLDAAGHEDEARRAVQQALAVVDRASDEDLLVLATLLCQAGRTDEATRLLYSVAATNRGEARDEAQVQLALLLAERNGGAPPSGLRSLLDPAHLDPGPSVVGGLLSLLWGGPPGSQVRRELADRDRRHVQASRAALLIEDLRHRRPGWSKLAPAELRMISAYTAYGAKRAALEASRRFLKAYPEHPEHARVGIETAHLFESVGQSGLPLLRRLQHEAVEQGDDQRNREMLREIEGLLSGERRFEDVVSTYWAAIEARPEDPGIYQDLLRFLEQHNLHEEQERVYQRAMARFADDDWASRYARWMLRRRGREASESLTRRIVSELPPGVVARFIGATVPPDQRGTDAHRFYLDIHLEALRRHPGDLEIVRQLFSFYSRYEGTYEAERVSLLVRYAPFDEQLRDALFVTLAGSGRLPSAIEQLQASGSVSGRLLAADFLIRRAEHEAARTVLTGLARDLPGHREIALRLADLEESLGDRGRARDIVNGLLANRPVDQELLTRAGELALSADDLPAARHAWGRIREARPGDRVAYRHVATLFWDYAMFDDAASVLVGAREALGDENAFAFELAAVHESAGNREPAVREYVRVLADEARRAETWPPAELRPRPPRSGPVPAIDEIDRLDREEETDDALVHVHRRLVELASREGDRDVVDAVVRDMLAQSPGDHGVLHVRVDLLQATGRWDEAYQVLAEAALGLNSTSIQERAIRELIAAGRDREATAVLRRQAQNRPSDLNPTFRLADHLERRGHIQDAAATLEALADRLATDETRVRDQETVTTRLARLLYAHQRFEDAVAAARRSIDLAQGERQQILRIELARWLARLERPAEAIDLVAPVLAQDPSSTDALEVEASSLLALGRAGSRSRQEVVSELVRTFDSAIAATRQRETDAESARIAVREIRTTLAAHLLEIGAHRAVLDQNVAMLNDDLEDETLLQRAFRHADANGLVDELERRYRRDAERSPRDHRLALVLARISAARGDLDSAATHMEQCLTIAPERMDLRQELIGHLVRQLDWTTPDGGWREAARQYRTLADLEIDRGGTGVRFTIEEARMYGRVGDWAAMDAAVQRLVTPSYTDPRRLLDAADLYVKAGRWPEAWRHVRAYLEIWRGADEARLLSMRYDAPELTPAAVIAVRSGRWSEASELLRDIERSWRASSSLAGVADRSLFQRLAQTARVARRRDTADALRTYGTDQDITRYVASLERDISDDLAGDRVEERIDDLLETTELAARAGSPRGQLDLLERLRTRLDGEPRARVVRSTARVVESMGAMRELQRLVDGDDAAALEGDRLALRLRAAATLGDLEAEEQALEEIIEGQPEPAFDTLDPRLERLLDIRWSRGESGRDTIPLLAAPADERSGQVINFLLFHDDHARAREALERYADGQSSLWLDTARAGVMLHRAERGQAPDDPEPFTRALDLRRIGELADRPADGRRALTGAAWSRLAQPYAEALARSEHERPVGTRMLEHAAIEAEPRSAEAHARLGREAMSRSEPGLAVTHYEIARRLAPSSLSIADGLARALIADGRRGEALALWDQVLGSCRGEDCVSAVFRAMNGAGLATEAQDRVVAYLRAGWRGGTLSLRLLRDLGRRLGERGRDRDGPLDRVVWELWQMDHGRMDLLEAAGGIGGESLLVGRARGRYLRIGLGLTTSGERADWLESYIAYLVEHEQYGPLVRLVEDTIAEHSADRYWHPPVSLQMALARGLLGTNMRARALDVLRDACRGDSGAEATRQAVALLRELGHDQDAHELQLEAASARLLEGDDSRATFLAAVEALLELGRADEASALASTAASRHSDEPGTLAALASLLADHGRHAEAERLRRVLYRIDRSDARNLLELARLEVHLGRTDAARRRALSLLARWAVPADVEADAVDLIVDLVLDQGRQRSPVVTSIGDSLDGHALDEDRALALARVQYEYRQQRTAFVVLERSIRESAAPWRSLELLASWEVRAGILDRAAIHLEAALVHGGGAMGIRRQLFLVRRRQGLHQAALAAIGIDSDRRTGWNVLDGLEAQEAIALCAEISDSAAQLGWWNAAHAAAAEGFRHIDQDKDPERARHERERLQAIRTHIDERRALTRGRPWIRRGR